MSERDQYIEKAKAKLDQWNAEIDKLKARADEAGADARIEYGKRLDEMRSHRDEAEKWLRQMRDSSDAAWSDMKVGFDRAWDQLSGAFERARSHYD